MTLTGVWRGSDASNRGLRARLPSRRASGCTPPVARVPRRARPLTFLPRPAGRGGSGAQPWRRCLPPRDPRSSWPISAAAWGPAETATPVCAPQQLAELGALS
jgi:hypothetical protein